MMVQQPIEVSRAAIRTSNVALRIITIDNKQMTLAVFRQLENEDPSLLVDVYKMAPECVWGWVNYCPADCDSRRDDHLHVVFTANDKLVRTEFSWELTLGSWIREVRPGYSSFGWVRNPDNMDNPQLTKMYADIKHNIGQLFIAV